MALEVLRLGTGVIPDFGFWAAMSGRLGRRPLAITSGRLTRAKAGPGT
ncbi:MAG TPA: hypothetical protein VLW44_05040 [Streptosporangiaceae bacterium]|nr:hypothetical protein [Streptosporangiaceae bacterium]